MNRGAHPRQRARCRASIFNSQPWSWTVHDDRMELRADRERRLASVDPSGRLLTVSCGVALRNTMVAVTGHLVGGRCCLGPMTRI